MKNLFTICAIFYSLSCFAQVSPESPGPAPEAAKPLEITEEQYKAAQKVIEGKLAQDKIAEASRKAAIEVKNETLAEAKAAEHEKNVASELDKWNLGFGIGVEQYREPYIEAASLNGTTHIVTLDEQFRTRPSAWLTTNWPAYKNWGFFVGVKIIDGNGESFSAFSLGPQYTFVTEDLKKISVGLGWVTHGTKQFANGIKSGEALPNQYDEIKYVKSTENSAMLMFTIGI